MTSSFLVMLGLPVFLLFLLFLVNAHGSRPLPAAAAAPMAVANDVISPPAAPWQPLEEGVLNKRGLSINADLRSLADMLRRREHDRRVTYRRNQEWLRKIGKRSFEPTPSHVASHGDMRRDVINDDDFRRDVDNDAIRRDVSDDATRNDVAGADFLPSSGPIEGAVRRAYYW